MLGSGLISAAQEGLEIDSIFEVYGKRQGSILLDIGRNVLEGHSRIERYKCLIITGDNQMSQDVCRAARNDCNRHAACSVLKESFSGEFCRRASYCRRGAGKNAVNEFILFACEKDRVTLVYLTGRFNPEKLDSELLKLKHLFIKINNNNKKSEN